MKGGQYVIFALGREHYGIPIESVEQILSSQEMTRIPNSSSEILGVFELRGKTLPVIDTRRILGMPSQESRCTIVVGTKTRHVALVADAVDRIVTFIDDQVIQTNDTVIGRADNGTLTILLDLPTLLPQFASG